jgi:hypothetical protein
MPFKIKNIAKIMNIELPSQRVGIGAIDLPGVVAVVEYLFRVIVRSYPMHMISSSLIMAK